MQSLGRKEIKSKRKQQHVANDSFAVESKTQKTMHNFLFKKLIEQTNYKFEQKKTNSRPILKKSWKSWLRTKWENCNEHKQS